MRRLERPRLRIEQAKVHRARIAELWNGFIEGDEFDPYRPVIEVDDEGQGTLCVYPDESLPSDALSLEFGELLYQLRASLDSLVYELAIIDSGQDPPPKAGELEFPIRSSLESFEKAAWKIRPLSERHRGMIAEIQPYVAAKPGETTGLIGQTLDTLNDLARRDRHRGLHVIGSWAANKDPLFRLPSGCKIESIVLTPDGTLESDNVVARFRVSGWTPGLEIEANPNLSIDISLDEPLPPLDHRGRLLWGPDDDTLSNRVKLMMILVESVIETFEKTLD